VLLWLVLAFKLDSEAEGAEQAGYVLGGWVAALAIALILRGVYVLARRRKVPFLSPWIFVIAAVIGLLVKLGDIGEAREARRARRRESRHNSRAASPSPFASASTEVSPPTRTHRPRSGR
jgi:hypothetical protein